MLKDFRNPRTESPQPILPLRESAYGVLVKGDEILLCYTKSGASLIVNFPGGAIERGEDRECAVVREFLEEVGAKVSIVKHLYSSDGSYVNPAYPENRVLFHYYLVSFDGPVNLNGNGLDVTSLKWFKVDQLPLQEMLPPDVEFCRSLPNLLASIG